MSQQKMITAASAAVTVAAVPQIQSLGKLNGVGKVVVGGVAAFAGWKFTSGTVQSVTLGAGIGLAVDGIMDFALRGA